MTTYHAQRFVFQAPRLHFGNEKEIQALELIRLANEARQWRNRWYHAAYYAEEFAELTILPRIADMSRPDLTQEIAEWRETFEED